MNQHVASYEEWWWACRESLALSVLRRYTAAKSRRHKQDTSVAVLFLAMLAAPTLAITGNWPF